tara:strand:- start:11 stop:304 length:294 start_codon:yes stop_codon:yes gene_type:complete
MKTEIKLMAEVQFGEGKVRIMPHFETMNTLYQLDTLKDWIHDLQKVYNDKVDEWEKELLVIEKEIIDEADPSTCGSYRGRAFRVKAGCAIPFSKDQT